MNRRELLKALTFAAPIPSAMVAHVFGRNTGVKVRRFNPDTHKWDLLGDVQPVTYCEKPDKSKLHEHQRGRITLTAKECQQYDLCEYIRTLVRRNTEPINEFLNYARDEEDVTKRCFYANEIDNYVDLYKRDETGHFYLNRFGTDIESERVWGWVRIVPADNAPPHVHAKLAELRQLAS